MTSIPRTTRIALSFAIVMIAYLIYASVANRWIEPLADANPQQEIDDRKEERNNQLKRVHEDQFRGLFAADRWELKNPKILENDRAKLLFQTYKNHPDGRVEFNPCTIVFASDGPGDEDQRRRQSIILEAPKGAVLQFDQPLDLGHFKMGRLVRGQLRDEVRIRSDWKEPGPQDDLLIVTHDIQLTEQVISTPKPVRFQWGPHFGSGQDMVIRLLAGQQSPDTEGSGPNIAGIESFELRRVERLHLDLGSTMADPKASNVAGRGPASQKPVSMPIDINCRGAFRFDVVGRIATFRDSVDIVKPNPAGPPDRIVCDLLSLIFTDRAKEKGQDVASTDPKKAGSLDLTVQRIEAAGKPVVVTAPSQKLVARGEKLVYDLEGHSIALEGGPEVFLQQGPNEIHARSLYYQSAAESWQMGRVAAQGPGWLRAQPPEQPNQQLEATWKRELRVLPDRQFQRIALTGGAELKLRGMGQLQAKQISFWFLELPPAKPDQTTERRPDVMTADGDVHMNSPDISSRVQHLEVWFANEDVNPGQQTAGVAVRPGGPRPDGQPGSNNQLGSNSQVSSNTQPTVQPLGSTSVASAGQPVSPRFEVTGRSLRTRMVLRGGQLASVPNLTIEDGVQFLETNAPPGERPLLLRGDVLEATDVASPNRIVLVKGQPARFEGRGLGGLIGSNIHLDCGANRLWIDGPGQVEIPLSTDFDGNPLVAPCVLTVDWQRTMDFDGKQICFEQSVVAGAPMLQSAKKATQFQLKTETMRIGLQRRISFSQRNEDVQPKPERFECSGGALMEQRDFDPQRQLLAYDRMEVADLGINILSGALTAGGPGWINHVGYGTGNPLGGPTDHSRASSAPNAPRQLNCLNVQFQKSISGNVRLSRSATFTDQVQLAYGPVNNWDVMLTTNDPARLGPDGIVAHCDELSVVQLLLPVGDRRAIEVAAQGNAVVEGTEFTAIGHRITYAEAKELLILEGNGLSEAKLFRQLTAGAERTEFAARKISYGIRTKAVKVEGAQSLQIGQPPASNRRQ